MPHRVLLADDDRAIRESLHRALDVMMPGGASAPVVQVGDLRIDPAACRAWWQATAPALSRTGFDLLELLARNTTADPHRARRPVRPVHRGPVVRRLRL